MSLFIPLEQPVAKMEPVRQVNAFEMCRLILEEMKDREAITPAARSSVSGLYDRLLQQGTASVGLVLAFDALRSSVPDYESDTRSWSDVDFLAKCRRIDEYLDRTAIVNPSD